MNYWAKVGLGVLGVSAVAGLWFGDEYYTKKEQTQKTLESRALNYEVKDVLGMTLKNDTGEFSFERPSNADKWMMKAPKVAKADEEAINELINAYSFMNVSSRLSDFQESDAAKYGLETPKLTLTLKMADGKTKVLRVGTDLGVGATKEGDAGTSVYAVSSDHKNLLVLGRTSIDSGKKSLSDFRTKTLGTFTTQDVRGFVLTKNDGTKLKLEKVQIDWMIKEPKEITADNNSVGLFLDKMAKLKLNQIQEPETLDAAKLGSFGLAQPVAKLEVTGEEGKVLQTIDYGMDAKNVYFKMEDGAVGSVDMGQYADLAPPLKHFRDRRVTKGIAVDKINKLTTKSGKTFTKEETNWYLSSAHAPEGTPGPDGKTEVKARTPDTQASSFVTDFEFLTSDDVVDAQDAKNLANFGLEKPITHVKLEFSEEGKAPLDVLVGNRVPKNETHVYVKHSQSENIYMVKFDWVEKLNKLDGQGTDIQAKKE